MLDQMFEQFDRYVLIKRIKLAPVSPLATGNEALAEHEPADAAEEKLDKFVAANKSAALKRYLALGESRTRRRGRLRSERSTAATRASHFYQGVETDLDALCISRR